MKLILEYKEFTEKTKSIEIVEHWLNNYFDTAYDKWLKSVEVFDKIVTDDQKQENWETKFWLNFGENAIQSVLGRISYKTTVLDTDLFSLIDKSDKNQIDKLAESIFDKVKNEKYSNSIKLFKVQFLDKIKRFLE